MRFDPDSLQSRIDLGSLLVTKLKECGFKEESSSGERVFSRHIKNNIYVVVYTTLKGNAVRGLGQDAIRISGVYRGSERERGLVKSVRVNRTGNMNDIVDRMHQRMRQAWKSCSSIVRCKSCNAPTFTSKRGNQVCVELCWTRKNEV